MPASIPRFPGKRTYRTELDKRYGRERAAQLMRRAEEHWRALYPERPALGNAAMQKNHLENSILPAISLYRGLLEADVERGEALDVMRQVLMETVRGRRDFVAWMAKYPFFFYVFRRILRIGFPLVYPPAGFRTEWVEDSPRCIAFNVYTCIFHTLLVRYGVPELTTAFCDSDDIYSDILPRDVRFIRTQTLGHGGTHCDFRYERIKPVGEVDRA